MARNVGRRDHGKTNAGRKTPKRKVPIAEAQAQKQQKGEYVQPTTVQHVDRVTCPAASHSATMSCQCADPAGPLENSTHLNHNVYTHTERARGQHISADLNSELRQVAQRMLPVAEPGDRELLACFAHTGMVHMQRFAYEAADLYMLADQQRAWPLAHQHRSVNKGYLYQPNAAKVGALALLTAEVDMGKVAVVQTCTAPGTRTVLDLSGATWHSGPHRYAALLVDML